MRRYTKVSPKFWTSPTVRSLSEDGRWLFLYLLTCPHNNLLGLFVAPLGYLTADLRWPEERVRAALKDLAEVPKASAPASRRGRSGRGDADQLRDQGHRRCDSEVGVISWDPEAELILIHDQLRHEGLANQNVVKAALRLLGSLPYSEKLFARLLRTVEELGRECAAPLVEAIQNRLPDRQLNGYPNGYPKGLPNPYPKGYPNGYPKGYPKGLGIQEQEQEQDPPPIVPPRAKVVSLEVRKEQGKGEEGKKGGARSRASPGRRRPGRRRRALGGAGKESNYAKYDK